MSARTIAWLAWATWAVCMTLAALATLLARLNQPVPTPEARFPIEEFAYAVTFSTVGALIATRRVRNPIGWIFFAIGLSHALSIFMDQYAQYTLVTRPGALPLDILWVGVLPLWAVGLGLLTFLFLLFPNGRLLSPRWRWLAWLSACGSALVALPQAIFTWSSSDMHYFDLDKALESTPSGRIVNALVVAGVILLFASLAGAIVSLIMRLYRATGSSASSSSGLPMPARCSSSPGLRPSRLSAITPAIRSRSRWAPSRSLESRSPSASPSSSIACTISTC